MNLHTINGLGPELQGLSPHLIATFEAIDYDGNVAIDPDTSEPEPLVFAPLVGDAVHTVGECWQSPYESMSPEAKSPAIAALLQSGAVMPLTEKIRDAALTASQRAQGSDSFLAPLAADAASAFARAAAEANDGVRALRGKTGITKLNSQQVFAGETPSKISLTLLLRAYQNPTREVMAPLRKLLQWAVPQALAPDSLLVGAITGSNGQSGLLNNLLPSRAPRLIRFTYGGRRWPPMVVESIEEPITSPRDKNGDYVAIDLGLSLATLTALDRPDITRMFQRAQAR